MRSIHKPKVIVPAVEVEKFSVVIASPPWDMEDGWSWNWLYGAMDVDRLASLPVASVVADDACLILWLGPSPLHRLEAAFKVFKAWGFYLDGYVTWYEAEQVEDDTEGKPAYGDPVSSIVGLAGTRGNMPSLEAKWTRFSSQDSPHRGDMPYGLMDHLSERVAGRKLYLFAGNTRPGWETPGVIACPERSNLVEDGLVKLAQAIKGKAA